MKDIDPMVPPQLRRFVGVWASKVGYGGTGRQAMMIITSIDPAGLATGYLVTGPPTKTSYNQSPSSYLEFSAKISGNKLEFDRGAAKRIVTMTYSKSLHLRDELKDGRRQRLILSRSGC